MSFWKRLLTTKDRVRYFLEKYPHLRDDDYKLMANFWHNEANAKGKTNNTSHQFLMDFANGVFTHPETIRRNRANLQSKNEHLQGEVYKERLKQGKEVTENIHDL